MISAIEFIIKWFFVAPLSAVGVYVITESISNRVSKMGYTFVIMFSIGIWFVIWSLT
jgi:hypothetical protein